MHFIFQKLRYLITPTRDWGPALPKHRKLIDYVDGWVIDPMKEKMAYKNKAFNSKSDLQVRFVHQKISCTNLAFFT